MVKRTGSVSSHLRFAVVLLRQGGQDGGRYDAARPVGGAAAGLEQLGGGPHQLQVRLTEVMLTVWRQKLNFSHKRIEQKKFK